MPAPSFNAVPRLEVLVVQHLLPNTVVGMLPPWAPAWVLALSMDEWCSFSCWKPGATDTSVSCTTADVIRTELRTRHPGLYTLYLSNTPTKICWLIKRFGAKQGIFSVSAEPQHNKLLQAFELHLPAGTQEGQEFSTLSEKPQRSQKLLWGSSECGRENTSKQEPSLRCRHRPQPQQCQMWVDIATTSCFLPQVDFRLCHYLSKPLNPLNWSLIEEELRFPNPTAIASS